LPDLSGFSTQINPDIPLYLPNLQWARYDVGYAGDAQTFEVDDDYYDPTNDPIDSDGFLDLPTGYMSSSSTTNGRFWVKTTAFANGRLYIWDGNGSPISELSIKKSAGNAVISINGGYSDQDYLLQSSSDLVHWSAYTEYIVWPDPDSLPQFSVPLSSAPKMFFRTVFTPPQ
jgi:hypothetical protein